MFSKTKTNYCYLINKFNYVCVRYVYEKKKKKTLKLYLGLLMEDSEEKQLCLILIDLIYQYSIYNFLIIVEEIIPFDNVHTTLIA